MATEVIKFVEAVLAEKNAVAAKEKQLIESLGRILPTMGYRLVPTAAAGHAGRHAVQARAAARPARAKSLACTQCDRTFAHPLHLGRHVSATHVAKRAARRGKAARSRKK